MPGEYLRLPVERRVVAIFGEQYLRQKRRRRQSAGDQPVRRRRLRCRLASPTGVFRAGDADHAKLGRNPVEHLADALADRMERATTARISRLADVEPHVLARQMIGQRLAVGWPPRWWSLDARYAFPDGAMSASRSSSASAN